MKKLLITFVAVAGFALVLPGCMQTTLCEDCPSSPPPPAVNCFAQLEKQGVQVIRTGETYTIVIPSDKLFYPDSANFCPSSDAILQSLTCFLQDYETTIMRVSGYTDNQGSHLRNMALSKKQAERVVEYLTEQQPDVRVMYAAGYNSYRPVAGNNSARGREQNRRIEIRFRKVVIPPL